MSVASRLSPARILQLRDQIIRDLASARLFAKLNPAARGANNPESADFYTARACDYSDTLEAQQNGE